MKGVILGCACLVLTGCMSVAVYEDGDGAKFALFDSAFSDRCICGRAGSGTVTLGGVATYFTDLDVYGEDITFAVAGPACTTGQLKAICEAGHTRFLNEPEGP